MFTTVNARAWISLGNLIAIAVAFALLFELPQYAGYAFYGLLGWILVSFVLLYTTRVGRMHPATPSQSALASPSGASGGTSFTPLPRSGDGGPVAPLDFCIYCGTALPPGSATCAACGHAVRWV
jgi:hypothetical protein